MTREEALHSLLHETNDRRTICEVFRMMWDRAALLPEAHPSTQPLRDLIIEGFIMGKKMDSALESYRERTPRRL